MLGARCRCSVLGAGVQLTEFLTKSVDTTSSRAALEQTGPRKDASDDLKSHGENAFVVRSGSH